MMASPVCAPKAVLNEPAGPMLPVISADETLSSPTPP